MNVSTSAPVDFDVAVSEIDPIEEMQLRTWARRNYVASSDRDLDWHPVVLDEMARIDRESL